MKKFLSFIMGLIIFSGLPFVGWGLNNISGFLENPARLAHVIMMAVLTLLVVIFVPEEGHSRGEGKKLVKKHKISLLILQVIPLLIVIISPFFDRHKILLFPEHMAIRIIGLVMTLIGFAIMNLAVMALGKQFSADVTIQDDHQLVTNGLYRFIRHPRYLGIIIFLPGISLIYLSLFSTALGILTIFVLIWRVRDEEELMHQEFKSEWEEYKEKTWAFIPYIY